MTSDLLAGELVSLLTRLRAQVPDSNIVDVHLAELQWLAGMLGDVSMDHSLAPGWDTALELRNLWESVVRGLLPQTARDGPPAASEASTAEQKPVPPRPDVPLAPEEDSVGDGTGGARDQAPTDRGLLSQGRPDGELVYRELVLLWGELLRDPKASPHLGDLGEPAGDPAALWRELHLAFWRLNTQQVERWKRQVRQRCGRLGLPEGAGPGSAGAAVVVPAFGLIGCPELRLGQPQAEWRKWVLAGLGADDAGRFPELVGALADVLLLLEEDKHVRIGWQLAYRKRELGGREHSGKFREFVRRRLQELAGTEPGGAAEFQLLVDLDEAVRSIVYDPVPAPSSWWAKNVDNLFRWMDGKSWENCLVSDLAGLYSNHINLTDPKMDIPKPLSTDSQNGWVLWTLRIWSQADGETTLGRVIYVPSAS